MKRSELYAKVWATPMSRLAIELGISDVRYCERLPKLVKQYERRGTHAWSTTKPEDRPPGENYGRYSLLHQTGLLNITASLDLMEWVLQFHASVFKGLTDGGMDIVRREATTERRSRDREDGPAVEAQFKGEVFAIEFSQGYRRIYLDTDELEERRKKHSWAGAYEQQPSQNLTFRLVASEYAANRTWQGTKEKLEGKVAEIVRAAFELVPLQIELREQRKLSEAKAKRAAEVRVREVRRAEARAEQVTQAFLMAKTDADVGQLEHFLHKLEERGPHFNAPYDQRAQTWITVVRNELARRDPVDELLSACLSVPSWKTWPPDWWPEDGNSFEEQGGVDED